MKYREQSTKNKEYTDKKNREAQLLAPPEIVWECPVLPFRG